MGSRCHIHSPFLTPPSPQLSPHLRAFLRPFRTFFGVYPEGGDFFGFLLSVAHWRSIVWVRVLCFVGLKSERGLDTTANLLHLALRTFPNVVSNPLYPLPSPHCASFFKFLLAARPIRVKSPALVASLPYTFISLSSMLYP